MPGTVITVGNNVTNRASSRSANITYIDLLSPCSADGILTQIQVWSVTSMTNFQVGIFRLVSGTTYKCVSVTPNLGGVTSTAVRTFNTELYAKAGDFIGYFYSTGSIEADTTGGTLRSIAGNQLVLNQDSNFSTVVNYVTSIKATGITFYTSGFRETAEKQFGTSVENNIGIVPIEVVEPVLPIPIINTPFVQMIEDGDNITLIALEMYEGKTFGFWRIINQSNYEYIITDNQITINITEALEIRAVYFKMMLRETVEYDVGPIYLTEDNISELRETVEYQALSVPTYEDYTTYTKVDPLLPPPNDLSAYVTLTANFLQWRIPTKKECTVYRDFGAAYFNGNFHVSFKLYCDSTTALANPMYLVTFSNAIKTMTNLLADNEDFITIEFRKSGTSAQIKIQQNNSGVLTSVTQLVSMNTFYGVRFLRNETTDKITVYFYNHGTDPWYLLPIFTLELNLAAHVDFRYLMVATGIAEPTGGSDFNNCSKGQIENLAIL